MRIFIILAAMLFVSCANRSLEYQEDFAVKAYNPPQESRAISDRLVVPPIRSTGSLPEDTDAFFVQPIPALIPEESSSAITMSELMLKQVVLAKVGINSRNQPALKVALSQQMIISRLAEFLEINKNNISQPNSHYAVAYANINGIEAEIYCQHTTQNAYITLHDGDGDYIDATISQPWLQEFRAFVVTNE